MEKFSGLQSVRVSHVLGLEKITEVDFERYMIIQTNMLK